MRDQNTYWVQWLVLAILITVGVASRFLIETPNFKPIAAFALFGGFFFRKPSLAIAGVLVVMALSDFRLGYYPWPLMVSVYLALTLSVYLGFSIRRRLGSRQFGFRHVAGFAGASLAMSTAFYVLTNGAIWMMGSWYPPTLAGLVDCYVAAIPFYRWTVLGDLFFTTLTVTCYATMVWGIAIARSAKQKQATRLSENALAV